MLDLWLIFSLGFLGSFGHCVGMCGPIAVAFSLSPTEKKFRIFGFHFWLNLGRIISYTLVGLILGGLGSFFLATGQLLGVGSSLRQLMAVITGLILIWFGLGQIKPNWLPKLPFIHPLQGKWQNQLHSQMTNVGKQKSQWTPLLLGSLWGLIPCGFLYTAQLKAIETGNLAQGGLTMLCFGLGTTPTMLTVGVFASKLSSQQRSQLFRLGGWVTLVIGILTLFRTDAMVDYTGHLALLGLMLVLVARPLSGFLPGLLTYRRAIGVGSFILALAHTGHMLDHSLNWNLNAIAFMLPQYRWGISAGLIALLLLTPAALTSFDRLQILLGKYWRSLHLLTLPALAIAILHTIFTGSNYLGNLDPTETHYLRAILLIFLALIVFCLRSQWLKFFPKP